MAVKHNFIRNTWYSNILQLMCIHVYEHGPTFSNTYIVQYTKLLIGDNDYCIYTGILLYNYSYKSESVFQTKIWNKLA